MSQLGASGAQGGREAAPLLVPVPSLSLVYHYFLLVLTALVVVAKTLIIIMINIMLTILMMTNNSLLEPARVLPSIAGAASSTCREFSRGTGYG